MVNAKLLMASDRTHGEPHTHMQTNSAYIITDQALQLEWLIQVYASTGRPWAKLRIFIMCLLRKDTFSLSFQGTVRDVLLNCQISFVLTSLFRSGEFKSFTIHWEETVQTNCRSLRQQTCSCKLFKVLLPVIRKTGSACHD